MGWKHCSNKINVAALQQYELKKQDTEKMQTVQVFVNTKMWQKWEKPIVTSKILNLVKWMTALIMNPKKERWLRND